MRAIIMFDLQGNIHTLARCSSTSPFGVGTSPMAGHEAVEVTLPEELESVHLLEIRRRYRIDPQARTLVKR